MESVLSQHDAIYGQGQGPPIFPHQNDATAATANISQPRRGLAAGPAALKRRRQRYIRKNKFQKQKQQQPDLAAQHKNPPAAAAATAALLANARHCIKNPTNTIVATSTMPSSTSASSYPSISVNNNNNDLTIMNRNSCSNLPASDLPAGFPPHLAYRALAAYSLIRTTSRDLRLSPFTPNVFLRALLLPVPSKLLGQVHVALLRVLLPGLHMGYHWGNHSSSSGSSGGGGGGTAGNSSSGGANGSSSSHRSHRHHGGSSNNSNSGGGVVPVQVTKKRKIDGLRWPLRGGDNLEYMDYFSWPIFFDDYAHLTADILYASWYSVTSSSCSSNTTSTSNEEDGNDNAHHTVPLILDSPYIDFRSLDISLVPSDLLPHERLELQRQRQQVAQRKVLTKIGSTRRETALPLSRNQPPTAPPPPPPPRARTSIIYLNDNDDEEEEEEEEENNGDDASTEDEFQLDEDDDDDDDSDEEFELKNRRRSGPPRRKKQRRGGGETDASNYSNGTTAMSYIKNPTSSSNIGSNMMNQTSTNSSSSSMIVMNHALPAGTASSTTSLAMGDLQRLQLARAQSAALLQQQQQQQQWNARSLAAALVVNSASTTSGSLYPLLATMATISLQQQNGSSLTSSINHHGGAAVRAAGCNGHGFGGGRGDQHGNGINVQPTLSMMQQQPQTNGHIWQHQCTNGQQQPRPLCSHGEPQVNSPQAQQLITAAPQPATPANLQHQQPPSLQETFQSNMQQQQQQVSLTGSNGSSAPHFDQQQGQQQTMMNLPQPRLHLVPNVTSDLAEEAVIASNPLGNGTTSNLGQHSVVTKSMNGNVMLSQVPSATASEHMKPTTATSQAEVQVVSSDMAAIVEQKPVDPVEQNVIRADKALEAFLWRRGNVHSDGVENANAVGEGHDDKVRSTNALLNAPARQPQTNSRSTDDIWTHFRALKAMRDGTPYHRLSIEKKLDILEFLIDDLLSVDVVADGMLKRSMSFVQSPSIECPYGPLPTNADIENMENEDYCAICGLEGDLLCCDGCTKSYHTKCLSIPMALPEGEWYCPECLLVDPAKIGPVNKGSLSALDWFDVRDLEKNSHVDHQSPPNVWEAIDSLASTSANDHDSGKPTTQYLAIHGFVFKRLAPSCRDQNPSWMSEPLLPMAGNELQSLLADLGLSKSRAWPLAQVPQESWLTSGSPLRAPPRHFLKSRESFDPIFYDSRYRLAPLPAPFTKVQDAYLSNYEDACARVNFHGISCLVGSRMDRDNELVEALQRDSRVFSPHQMIHDFMLNLEANIAKSFLLDPNWGTDGRSSANVQMDVWRGNVRSCRSIPRLCGFLLQFVDALHPRVFKDDWFNNPTVKSEDRSDDSEQNAMFPLASDSTPDGESRRRSWERCAAGNLERLLARDATNASDWIHKLRPELAAISYTRKQRKKGRKGMSTERPVESGASEKCLLDGNLIDEGKTHDTSQDEHSKSRRRSDRACAVGSADKGHLRRAENMATRIEHEQNARMAEMVKDLQSPPLENTFWPVCGRGFIDPPGRLPRKEVRRLGRCAGTVHAPFVQYPRLHEVGQFSYYHIWRKRVMHCDTLEEMLILNRMLSSFINNATVSSSKTIARRHGKQKNPTKSNVYCVQQDIKTGEKFYFILDKSGSRGRWLSWRDVDIETLSIYYTTKRAERIQAFNTMSKQRKEARAITYWAAAIKPTPPQIPVQIPKPVKRKKVKQVKAHVGQPHAKGFKAAAQPRVAQPHATNPALPPGANPRISEIPPAVQPNRVIAAAAAASNPELAPPQFNNLAQLNHLAQLPQSQMSMLPQAVSFGTNFNIAFIGQELSRILENHTRDMTGLLERFGGNVPDLHVQALRLTNILRAKNILSCVKIPFDDGLFSQNLANAEAKAIEANKKQGAAFGQGSISNYTRPPQQSSSVNTLHVSTDITNNPALSVNSNPRSAMHSQGPPPSTSSQIYSQYSNSNLVPSMSQQQRPATQTISQSHHNQLDNTSLSPRPFSNEGSVLQQQRSPFVQPQTFTQQAPFVQPQTFSPQQANQNGRQCAGIPNAASVGREHSDNPAVSRGQSGRRNDFSNLEALLSSHSQSGRSVDFSNLETLLQRVMTDSHQPMQAPANGHGRQDVVHANTHGGVVNAPGVHPTPVGIQSHHHHSKRKASKVKHGSAQTQRHAMSYRPPPNGPQPVAMDVHGHLVGGSHFCSEQSREHNRQQYSNPQKSHHQATQNNSEGLPPPYAFAGGGPEQRQQKARDPTLSHMQQQATNAKTDVYNGPLSNSHGRSHNPEFHQGSTPAQHEQQYQQTSSQQPTLYGGPTGGPHAHSEQHWQHQQQLSTAHVHQPSGHVSAPSFAAPTCNPYHSAGIDSTFGHPPHHSHSVSETASYHEGNRTSDQQQWDHLPARCPPPPPANFFGGSHQPQPAVTLPPDDVPGYNEGFEQHSANSLHDIMQPWRQS